MEPIGVWVRKNGEWAIIHRCKQCGHISSNRVAADDNPMKLMSIAMKPLTCPPFPLEYIEKMTEDDIDDNALSEWLNAAESDDPVNCGFPRCKKHNTLLTFLGCQICNN